jgi:hypothetical protein
MKIFQLVLEIVHTCSLFHEKVDILVFDSTDCPVCSVVKCLHDSNMAVSSRRILLVFRHLYFINSIIKNFQLLLEKKYVNNFTLCEDIPFTFHVTAGNRSRLLGQ